MPKLNYLVVGYQLAFLALVLVCSYFVVVALASRLFVREEVLLPRYEPPPGASPAVAAWLFERGNLSRAVAAAVVNMAAKGYLKIEQSGELYSLTRLGPEVSLSLEPEEDALARTLFKGYDCFDFDEPTPELRVALKEFRWALIDTTYFSPHIALSVPAWIISGFGILFALLQGNYHPLFRGYGTMLSAMAFGCLIVAVRTLPGTLDKAVSRLPGSTAPLRPWTGADSMTLNLMVAALGGVAFLALQSTTTAALLTAAFVGVNAAFFYALQGPTSAGRKVMTQLAGYRKFLAEVDADAISRTNPIETTPAKLNPKHAYALAFHLDLGWGEQFVTSIADMVECAQVFGKIWRFQRLDVP